ncbi:cell surface protein [Candidatus Magnetobacterium bavaricum]|uniref:Cell surface protein n=1 Tax=Candidatus Magnetobacterium bavaricum TaxID=29290 RepID=A0A0F3GS42_9BACT|nr:cell surface protein [Candidatus Magnetobacterium bavaricum]
MNFPIGIATDGSGNAYVADTYNHRILKYTSSGQLITTWGSYGSRDRQFNLPRSIVVDSAGNIYIVDGGNNRIQKFNAAGQLLVKWGSFGSGDGQFDWPRGITVDGNGDVYVADANNNRIQKFNSGGQFLAKWGTKGSKDGELSGPVSPVADNSGDIYVADAGNHRIQKFNAAGVFLAKWGSKGNGDGQFLEPSALAIDGKNNVYVADTGNNRLQKFNATGQFLARWGKKGNGNGEFDRPLGLTVDKTGDVFVADSENDRIEKFNASGEFLAKWSSRGTDKGEFDRPFGVALDDSGNVYVADTYNNRLQKLNADGQSLLQWGGEGSGDGQLSLPFALAVDSSGNIYVADSGNNRIQKFNSSGQFLAKWGSFGNGDGQFNMPIGIAVDAGGNIYVADSGNNRLQKFNAVGVFLVKWGSPGSGDGQFDSPSGIAIDGSGNIYVSDTGNNRLQKFNSAGVFMAKWGSKGTDDGQFNTPFGISADKVGGGYVYVTETGGFRVQKFTTDGAFVGKIGGYGSALGQFITPYGVAATKDGKVYVADSGNNRIQVLSKESTTTQAVNKAILVAGSGPNLRPRLWDEIRTITNHAYDALEKQGFSNETIYYLTYDTELDLDQNGVFINDGTPTRSNLKKALTEWAVGANDVVVYLAGHGGSWVFKLGETENVNALELAEWLNTIQGKISGKLTFVYEASRSGSFLSSMKLAQGQGRATTNRVVIASASYAQNANFLSSGVVSFSYPFWSGVANGQNVFDSFVSGKEIIAYDSSSQTPLLDDNGNGIGGDATDGAVAKAYTIGKGLKHAAEVPTLGNISVVLNGTSGTITIDKVISTRPIQDVWAIISPPDFNPDGANMPITSLPTVTLSRVGGSAGSGGDSYSTGMNGLIINGDYTVTVYVTDDKGNMGLPVSQGMTQTNGVSSGPVLSVKANGQQGQVGIKTTDTLTVTIGLDAAGSAGINADWWLVAATPFGSYYYDTSSDPWMWKSGSSVTYTGPLFSVGGFSPFVLSGLPVGIYDFSFKTDFNPDGGDDGSIYSSTVTVNVSQ